MTGELLHLSTAWKVSKYGVISGPITGKCGPEITLYLDTFHAVEALSSGFSIMHLQGT